MILNKLYKNLIITKPKFTLSILLILLLSFGYYSKDFQLDASSDTLLLENDPDLKYLREVNSKYGTKDFLVLTYRHLPNEDYNFKSNNTIKNIGLLKNSLENLDWVDSVITILDVPLLKNNDDPLSERIRNFKTLSSADVDLEKGFEEIIESPIYKNFVISEDGKTSGILVYIKPDKKLSEFVRTKNDYLERKSKGQLVSNEKSKYKAFLEDYDAYKKNYNKKNHQNINEIRIKPGGELDPEYSEKLTSMVDTGDEAFITQADELAPMLGYEGDSFSQDMQTYKYISIMGAVGEFSSFFILVLFYFPINSIILYSKKKYEKIRGKSRLQANAR